MKKSSADLSISDLEKELGIGKDTLRVWERRYGFPKPTRDAAGKRRYPPDQVDRLRLMRRLLDQGMRPHQVLGLPVETLREYSAPSVQAAMQAAPIHSDLHDLLKRHDALALQHALRTLLLRARDEATALEALRRFTRGMP